MWTVSSGTMQTDELNCHCYGEAELNAPRVREGRSKNEMRERRSRDADGPGSSRSASTSREGRDGVRAFGLLEDTERETGREQKARGNLYFQSQDRDV